MTSPFALAFALDTPLGTVAAVRLPLGREPVPASVLEAIAPDEKAVACTLHGRRQIEWVGGRLAFRLAARRLGLEPGPLMTGERGEPMIDGKVAGSISHKTALAVALVAPRDGGSLGLDLEELARPRPSIAARVLRPEELADVERLAEAERWPAIVRRFALKEAVYKAVHPYVRRYVRFDEASVALDGGGPRVTLHLARNEGPFAVDAALLPIPDETLLLAAVRIVPR